MTSLLQQYEQQYSTLTAEITSRIGRLPNLIGSERRDAVNFIENQLEDVQELLDQMELSVREIAGGPERSKYEHRLKSYTADSDQLKKALSSTLRSSSGDRDELLTYEGSSGIDDDHKSLLLNNTERLERSSRKLDDGFRVAVETEEVGTNILNDLESQRGVLNRARDRLREAEDDLGQSSQVLNRMIRRVIQNRLVLVLIVAAMLIIIGVVIFITAKKNS